MTVSKHSLPSKSTQPALQIPSFHPEKAALAAFT